MKSNSEKVHILTSDLSTNMEIPPFQFQDPVEIVTKKHTESSINAQLDVFYKNLTKDKIDPLFRFLNEIRLSTNKAEWKALLNKVILAHPISKLLHQDPCTHHSFTKPRGYPGDADLLDFFYRKKTPLCL